VDPGFCGLEDVCARIGDMEIRARKGMPKLRKMDAIAFSLCEQNY
jgi:hypothetical protein